MRARLWLAQPGRPLAAVERWAAGCQVSLDTLHDEHPFALFNHHIHLQQLTLVRLRIARYRERGAPDLQPVLDFLTRDLQRTEQNGWIQQVIELLILLALTLDAQGNTDQALVALQRALALAEPEGYVRTFVDEGAPMAALLERIKDEGGRMKDYITRLLTTFPAEIVSPVVPAFHPSSFIPQPLVEPLSERELEVLRLLAEGLSNQEIAQRLVIAPGTVKAHATHIYGKLDVTSRTRAVARARELGLLPPR